MLDVPSANFKKQHRAGRQAGSHGQPHSGSWLGAAWGRCGTTASGKRPRTGPSGPVVSRIQEWCGLLKWSCCLCHVELGNNGDLINPPFWTGHRQEHHGGPGAEGRSTPKQRGFGLWLHFPDLPPMLQVVSFSPKSAEIRFIIAGPSSKYSIYILYVHIMNYINIIRRRGDN